jgi:hypothetical protein
VQGYHDAPGTRRLFEDRVTTSRTSVTQSFTYNGSGPIRATLCWTDPAAAAATSSDSRTAKLVNNLDLKLLGPGGTIHQPFVMPYVGDWTAAKLTAPATTGVNNTDNVEQVLITAPPAAGVYQAVVTFSGTLTNGAQPFSLVLSGGATSDVAPAPSITAITPNSTVGGPVTLSLTSANVLLGATVKLTRSGQSDVKATGIEVQGDVVKARVSTDAMVSGAWNVVVTNPDGQSFTLPNAFAVSGALWADQLETGGAGWSHSAAIGTDGWGLTTTQSHSGTTSFFSSGPATRTDDSLISPAIAVPSGSSNLQLTFWHNYTFESGTDGGVLEFSIANGAYFDVTSSGSGAAFLSGGYTSALAGKGPPGSRNPLAGRNGWSATSNGWTQVVVALTDATKYAGKTLNVRWRLGTNSSTASTGWWIDDISLAGATAANLPPNVVTPASAGAAVVVGKTTTLGVVASDDGGESGLTYTWSVNDTFDAPIQFTENGTNAAKNTTATFARAGLFTFTCAIRDAGGLVASSGIDVQVDQTLTSVAVTPASVTLGAGATQQFTASALDQFDEPMTVQPAFAWTSSGGGSVTSSGLFTAGSVPGGPFSVTAAAGAVSAAASVTITGQTLASWQSQYFTATEIAAGKADPAADADGDGLSNLLEYALGSDPRHATAAPIPSIVPDAGGQPRLTLTFTRPRALPGVTLGAEVSGDLKSWSNVPTLEITSTATADTVTARDPVPATGAGQRFMRLWAAPAP